MLLLIILTKERELWFRVKLSFTQL